MMRMMGMMGFLLAALGLAPAWAAPTPDSPEQQAFRTALNLFNGEHYQPAEAGFNDFLAAYTNSPAKPLAILYLARARLEQSNFTGAIDLLEKSSASSGPLQSEYLFWVAKARLATGDLTRAGDGFAAVARDFPSSPKRLEAAYEEAEVQARTNNWPGVIRLLQPTNGPFQVSLSQDARTAGLGRLLLGEAYWKDHRAAEGEKALKDLDAAGLPQDDLRWRRQYLLCRVQLDAGRTPDALAGTSNLITLALDPRHQGESYSLQADILEKLGRPADALAIYTINLADSPLPEVQRQAMARIIPLTVATNPWPQAIQALEALITRHPQSSALDLARVSLGELYLKVSANPPIFVPSTNIPATTETNWLAGALTNFNIVISNYANSDLLAKARLDRGWCEWLATNIAPARADFEYAAGHLPLSADQAVARFKWADAQFILKDYAGAASNYGLVLSLYANLPEVTNAFFDLALYQLAEADIQRGDDEGAGLAVDKILRWYPGSFFGERGLLLQGEDLNRKYDFIQARKVFLGLLDKSPHSPLRPKVEYAIARTFDYEGLWKEAIDKYKNWETNHPGHALLPAVEFHLALACGKAGLTNEALAGLTNFVARFRTNEMAPWALNWLGEFYYNQGVFLEAEKYYQDLFQKYPEAGELDYQARFWAGKSALARPNIEEATNYLVPLVNLTNAPTALVARGYFAWGDSYFQQFLASPTNEDALVQAINIYSKWTNGAPTNAMAVEALGQLGAYWMAWADKNPGSNSYAHARLMFETIANFHDPNVSPAARSQAECGLGLIAEREGQTNLALAHYGNVLYKYDPGSFDPYWMESAGESAARLYETGQHWNEAMAVYRRLRQMTPALASVLDKKMEAARARWERAGK